MNQPASRFIHTEAMPRRCSTSPAHSIGTLPGKKTNGGTLWQRFKTKDRCPELVSDIAESSFVEIDERNAATIMINKKRVHEKQQRHPRGPVNRSTAAGLLPPATIDRPNQYPCITATSPPTDSRLTADAPKNRCRLQPRPSRRNRTTAALGCDPSHEAGGHRDSAIFVCFVRSHFQSPIRTPRRDRTRGTSTRFVITMVGQRPASHTDQTPGITSSPTGQPHPRGNRNGRMVPVS